MQPHKAADPGLQQRHPGRRPERADVGAPGSVSFLTIPPEVFLFDIIREFSSDF
jgi:hypothetical protein